MEDIKQLLGQKIKELRKNQRLSQQQLAELANIDQRSLSHIECGNTFPSKILINLSKALNIKGKNLKRHKLLYGAGDEARTLCYAFCNLNLSFVVFNFV